MSARASLRQLALACWHNQISSLLKIVLPLLTIIWCRPSVRIYSDFFLLPTYIVRYKYALQVLDIYKLLQLTIYVTYLLTVH